MSAIPANKRTQAIVAACESEKLRKRRVPRRLREHMARDITTWACDLYDEGEDDIAAIESQVRSKAREEYGSILVMIAFAIIWEIIKRCLFD